MLMKILAFAVLLIGGFLVYVAMLPSDRSITRELVINATPEELFPYINNSRKMNAWMPWKESDPGLQMEYSGPEEGVGSKARWDSKGKMGIGNSVVLESIPNKSVKSQLTYLKPMEMSQLAEVSLTPVDGGTRVTWSVDMQNGFFFKLFGVIMNMDKMVGGEFEKGLGNLKKMAETK